MAVSDTCTTGFQYLVFHNVAKDIAEVNGYTYAESPHEATKLGCKNLIMVDNLNNRNAIVARRWKMEKGGEVILYGLVEGVSAVTPGTLFGKMIKDLITIVVPSRFVKSMFEESGFEVKEVIPHGVDIPQKVKGYSERERKAIYRAYYIKRKFPPYGILAVRKALEAKLPVEIYVRDDLYPKDLEIRHKQLATLLPVKFENTFNTPLEHVYQQFESALYFLNLSDSGGFELEVLESMAHGTPVITAYFPPISEYYPKNELTIDVKGTWWEQYPLLAIKHSAYDADEMLEKLKYALSLSQADWERLSAQVREAAKNYDKHVVYKAFEKLLAP